jgi:hypothetical protein
MKKFIILVLFVLMIAFTRITFSEPPTTGGGGGMLGYVVNLKAGHNPLSSPFQEGINFQKIKDSCNNYTLARYWTGTSYADENSTLKAGKGYIVTVLSDCSFNISGTPYTIQPIELSAGVSYLIGAFSTTQTIESIRGTCNANDLQVLIYDRETDSNIPASTIEIGKAYWIKSNVSCTFGKAPIAICTDSDGGKNYYVKGYTTGPYYWQGQFDYSVTNVTDYCESDTDINSYLMENYCEDNGSRGWIRYQCPYGCKDGACIIKENSTWVGGTLKCRVYLYSSKTFNSLSMKLVTDNKTRLYTKLYLWNDNNGNVGNEIYSSNNISLVTPSNLEWGDWGWINAYDGIPNYYGYHKITMSSVTLSPGYYWIGVSQTQTGDHALNVGVFNDGNQNTYCIGAANDKHIEWDAYYKLENTSQNICTDSDGGKSYYVKGTVARGSESKIDSCTYCTGLLPSPVTCGGVVEYYCSGEDIASTIFVCPSGYTCKDGACLQSQTCTLQTDCTWCGSECVKRQDNMICPMIAPPQGYNCVCDGGSCTKKPVEKACVNHDECSQACDNLNISLHWMGSGYSYRSWSGTCPSRVYGCMTGQCCLGQCAYQTTGQCFCQRTNLVDIYGSVCPSGQTCGQDCYCHPIVVENRTCSDSDNGKNYYMKGCLNNGVCDQCGLRESNGSLTNKDYCKDESNCVLFEVSCTSSGQYGGYLSEDYKCPYGCKNGACLNQPEVNCVNHDECSQACDNLGINSKWMGIRNSYRSWDGTCPSRVYGCMTGKCCLGQCNQEDNCFCMRTNVVDIYGSICPEGTSCGEDCSCHPIKEEFKFNVKTDKYSYLPGEDVRITGVLSGDSINFNEAKVITIVTDSQGKTYDVKMEPIGISSSTCQESVTGTYMCSITTEYHFVGTYNIPSDGPIGSYRIMSTAIAGGFRKNDEINFVVGRNYNDYVDISISPQEQLTYVGKEVKYDVTIIDKHPVMKCEVTISSTTPVTGQNVAVAEPPTSGGTSVSTTTEKCGPQIYNYLIDVDGLPYHTVFPNVISVHAGGSKTFELKVFPSPAKTEEGITTAVQTTTTTATTVERSVSITGKPIATEQGVSATTPVTTELKEAAFKFAVKASLKEEQTTSDTVIGVLRVRFVEEPEPPPFPEVEKIIIELKMGWNLISVPGKGIGFIKGTCLEDQKPIAFVYSNKKHLSFEESLKVMGEEEILNYLSTHSFWIYSYEDCNIGFRFKSYSTYSGLKVNEGWNLLGITRDMVGETLSNIKGNCTFERIYKWDSNSQKWIEKSENDLIEEKGYGIAVKATEDCNLKTNIIQPPPFPGD